MAKYRKKPVVIDAVQIIENNNEAILDFMEETGCPFEVVGDHEVVIHTFEGDMLASKGDWVICGVKGEFYPCKPDIFEQTYDLVVDE